MLDFINEILDTIRQNKLRASMTGFSIAWGIWMLIILLGAGNGLLHGVENRFSGISANSMFLDPGQTQMAYEGIKPGRDIQFRNDDYKSLRSQIPGITHISGRANTFPQVSYGNEYGTFKVEGVLPEVKDIVIVNQLAGRYINEYDINENRKVAVISQPIKKLLFGEKEALGEYVRLGKVSFLVVGVIENRSRIKEKIIYVPLSTAQIVYHMGDKISNIAIRTNAINATDAKKIEDNVRSFIARKHHFNNEDKNAIWIYNALEDMSKAQGIFAGIRLFIWIIGIMTIIAGIMGISNIMIILVKERKKEIGIRKALGATPWSIVKLVLSESLFITIVSGFLGLVAGMGILALVNKALTIAAQGEESMLPKIFYNPTADVWVALSALTVLVVCGLIAGYIPASNAAAIKPIEALQEE